MNNPKNFDLDKFLNHLEMDEELALAEVSKPRERVSRPYRPCPRCGTKRWRLLNVDERGKAESCDRCEDSEQ